MVARVNCLVVAAVQRPRFRRPRPRPPFPDFSRPRVRIEPDVLSRPHLVLENQRMRPISWRLNEAPYVSY